MPTRTRKKSRALYSPEIIDRRLRRARAKGVKTQRLSVADSIGISERLERLRKNSEGGELPEGQLARPLFPNEQAFIESERAICKCDFTYFFTRYYCLELDPGVGNRSGIGPPVLLESQKRYIKLLGHREEECYEELKSHKFTLGIYAYFHKVRQVAATATARAASLHRLLFWPGTRAYCAGLNEDGRGELFKRDHTAIDNLPFWLKPRLYPDVKDTELGFPPPLNSRIGYGAENQQAGIGTGKQVDVSHLTEVALWQYPGRIRFSFVPAIPKAFSTLHIQESTSDGKGNYWHEVTEHARHKRRGYEHWIYAFIPWWYNKLKYRSVPPANWKPEKHTIRHAALIERTSPEFNDGVTYFPSVEQLYWWESSRAEHARNGELATFLTNYPATPEQSFQNPSQGALPVELIEEMEQDVALGKPYDVEVLA